MDYNKTTDPYKGGAEKLESGRVWYFISSVFFQLFLWLINYLKLKKLKINDKTPIKVGFCTSNFLNRHLCYLYSKTLNF